MGDVVYQHGAADGVGRASAINIGDLHWLQEVGIGGGCVDSVAIGERIVQRLQQRGLAGDLLVVGCGWDFSPANCAQKKKFELIR